MYIYLYECNTYLQLAESVCFDLYEDYKLVKSVYTGSLVVEHLWLQDGVLFFKDSDHLIRALDRQGVISKASISLSDIDPLDTVGSKRYYLDERNHLMVEEQTTGEIFDYGKVNASKISVSWNYLVLEEIMVNGSKFTRVIPMFAIEDYL